MVVARGIGAIRRVVDGAHDAQHRLAVFLKLPGMLGHPRPFERQRLGVALHAPLGALVHHPAGLPRVGRNRDPSVLVEQADTADAALAAEFLDDVEQRVAVVAQHLVARAAQDDVGDARGRLLHHAARIAPLDAQVDPPEQREKGRGAGDDAHRQLDGQTEPDSGTRAHPTATASSSVSPTSSGAASCACASNTGKY